MSKIRLSSAQCERIRESLRHYDAQRGQGRHAPIEDLVEEILNIVLPEIEFSTQVREERPYELAELIGGGVEGAGPILPRADASAGESVVDGSEANSAQAGAERQRDDHEVDG